VVFPAGSADRGALPASQPISVTLYLAPTADRTAALMQYLTDMQTPGGASYHAWLTPLQFGQQFGASAAQIADVLAFASANGLTVASVSPSSTRVTLSGSVAQIEAAMAPALHQIQIGVDLYYANTAAPTLPEALSTEVLAIDGLSTLPEAYPLIIGGVAATDSLAAVSSVVDANSVQILAISGSACLEDFSAANVAAIQMALRQASAQGMTVLASSGCGPRGSAGFPSTLSEVTAVALAPGLTPATNPVLTELRPVWQQLPGLPADNFRHEPDLTVSSLGALSQAMAAILLKQPTGANGSASRLGNINPTLYSMAQSTDVFSQPDSAPRGTWEAATGIGDTDLDKLDKQFPHANALSDQVQLHVNGGGTHGTTLSIYATVTDTSGSNGSPSGTVTLTSTPAGLSCGALTVSNGTSTTCTTNQLPAASYTFTATYTDPSGTYASNTGTASQTIQPEDSALTASASGTATFGSNFTVTVTDRSASGVGTPTGTINIVQNGGTTTIPSQTLTSSTQGVATATFSIPATAAGSTVSYTVTCSSTNQSFTCNTPYQLSVSVAKATPTGTLTISPTVPVYGTATSFTQTFAGPSGFTQPTGYSQVNENGTYVTSGTLVNGTVTTSATTVSGTVSNSFTANYQGDSNYNPATATASTVGTKITTTLNITAPSATSVVTGTGVSLNATLILASAPTGLAPTGTVQFYANGQQVGQAVAVNGTGSNINVSLSYVVLPLGTEVISAVYTGDTNYNGSSSTNTNVTVLVGPATTITLAASGSTSLTFGGSATVIATVAATPTSGASTPTGSLIFSISGGGLTTAVTQTIALTAGASNTSATATVTFPLLTAGSYAITATCTTVNFSCSNVTSNTITVTVAKAATTTALTSNPSSPTAGQSVTLTATVTMTTPVTGLTPSFTGTVTFYDNGASLGSPSITTGGIATLVTALAGASDTVTAVYSGDSNFLSSTGTLAATIQAPVKTTTVVTSNTTLALAGTNIILSASISDAPTGTSTTTPATPSGTVSFFDTYNGQMIPLGTVALTSTGPYTAIGQLSTTGLMQGTHNITAVFGTTTSFVGSTSTALVINITNYGISFSPAALTVNAGSSATAVASITAVNGFNGQVVLGCTPPSGTATTCSFNPAVINANGFPATSQLLITTTPGQAGMKLAGWGRDLTGAALGVLVLGFLLPSVRRRRPMLMALLLSCLTLGSLGCTNLVNTGNQTIGNVGTPLGTQIFNITTSGTDGHTTETHNVQFQVTVQ
jgi:hypothetical protein